MSSFPCVLSRLVVVLVGLSCLAPYPAMAGDNPAIKRITVLETSNNRLDRGVRGMALPANLDAPEIAELRGYISPLLKLEGDREFDLLRAVTQLVYSRLKHTPVAINLESTNSLRMFKAGASGSQTLSCIEYSQILRDMLHAQGVPARSVGVLGKDIAYGGLGSSHVLVEAWSNQFDKWVILDAQFGLYAERDGIPQNVFELHEALSRGEFDKVRFVPVSKATDVATAQATVNEYRQFIVQYFAYMNAQMLADEERVPVLLRLSGKDWPLTSHGLARKAHIIADDKKDFYFSLNHTSLLLEFRRESQPINQKEILINSEADYREKMAQFAAVPDFNITPHNNMPWFSHYEYRLDQGEWQKVTEGGLRWILRDGINSLAVRAVNHAGRRGPVTLMKIRYAS